MSGGTGFPCRRGQSSGSWDGDVVRDPLQGPSESGHYSRLTVCPLPTTADLGTSTGTPNRGFGTMQGVKRAMEHYW